MTSTQVSFSAFALAQQAASCTPPASTPVVPGLVAQDGSGGECTRRVSALRLARYERRRAHPRYLARTYVTHFPGLDVGPAAVFWFSRAHAFNFARRCGSGVVFFDLGGLQHDFRSFCIH